MNGYNEDFQFEGGVLYIRLSGKFPNELLGKGENLFQPLVNACSTHSCEKALIDARDLQVDFSTTAMFQAGVDAASVTRSGLRIAIVAREDMIDPFFDDVVFNRGGHVSIFTDIGTAQDWLRREQ